MVQESHFHQALLLREGSTAQFISSTQCRFAPASHIFLQARAVLIFKTLLRLGLASNGALHGLIPVKRVIKTSASSFPLRYCSRILSAALCGFSFEERLSGKSFRTPSAANKSGYPRSISHTVSRIPD